MFHQRPRQVKGVVVLLGTSMKPLDRLMAANPGWYEWSRLINVVKTLSFDEVSSEYLGKFYTSDRPLVFSDAAARNPWPTWLPRYVPALFGMKAADWEMAGGYADSFYNEPARKGAVFSPAGNDADMGYPLIDIPADVFCFQSNSSGAEFFVNKSLVMLYPNSETKCFERLDTLEEFTKKNIRQAIAGAQWIEAYTDLKGTLLD
jgi:hypothetical protein